MYIKLENPSPGLVLRVFFPEADNVAMYHMSPAATQTHMCIYMALYYEQKCTHTTQTTVCFSFTGQSSSFHGSCMCRPFVSTLRRRRREQCKANACFPLSQVRSPVPWKPRPAQFSSVHHCTSTLCLASLPSSGVALLISLVLQKAIRFVLSTLQILARGWKETFTNYVEPTTRIPETTITEEISKVE